MKKILWLFGVLGVLLYVTACNNADQRSNEGYVLKGSLKGIDSGVVKLTISNEEDRTSKTIDSGLVKNGQFELKGKIDVPRMATLKITPGNWSFEIFVEDTILSITADTTGSEHYDYTAYGYDKGAVIKNFTESGSHNYDDWMKYQNDPGQKQYEPVFAELEKKFNATKDIDSQYKVRDEMDSVRRLLQAWQKTKIDEYISQHPASVAGVYMFNTLYMYSQDMPVKEMENVLGKYQGKAKESVYYKSLTGELAKKKAVEPGSIAPDFTLLKRDSSSFTLSSARGKYVMLDFWASWCHPCRQAIPHWKEVYKKYHDKGFEIISVSDDSRWPDWIKAMDQEKMPWTQVCDEFPVKDMPARVGSLYMTRYIPFYVLLDKDGKILVYSGKEEDVTSKLKEIFGA